MNCFFKCSKYIESSIIRLGHKLGFLHLRLFPGPMEQQENKSNDGNKLRQLLYKFV